MNQQETAPKIGKTVRKARKNLGLTLAELSERSGVSRSMLSAIERDTVNPTFSVVWRLAQSLGIDLVSVDTDMKSVDPIEHLRSYSTPVRYSEDRKVTQYMLSPRRSVLPVEWHDIHFDLAGELNSAAHAEGTYEHLTCIEGKLSVSTNDTTVIAECGDTVRYRADRPHSIENVHEGKSRGLLLVAQPSQYKSG